MTEGTAALTYAVRPAVVARYLGQLALVQAAFSTVPLAVALGTGDHGFAARLAAVFVVLIAAGLPATRLPRAAHLQTNEVSSWPRWPSRSRRCS